MSYSPPSWCSVPSSQYKIFEVTYDDKVVCTIKLCKHKGHMTIGHDKGCDISLSDASSSPMHAVIASKEDGSYYVYDLGTNSKNITLLNGKPVKVKDYIQLNEGDRLQFGPSAKVYTLRSKDSRKRTEPDADGDNVPAKKPDEKIKAQKASPPPPPPPKPVPAPAPAPVDSEDKNKEMWKDTTADWDDGKRNKFLRLYVMYGMMMTIRLGAKKGGDAPTPPVPQAPSSSDNKAAKVRAIILIAFDYRLSNISMKF